MGDLTASFSLAEFSVSASHPALVVPVPKALAPKVERLAVDVLQPIRDAIGRPMRILSGYRSRDLNRAVGGSVTSQHVRGEAADFTASDIRGAWLTILSMVGANKLPGAGQLIYYPDKGFVHTSLPSGRYARPVCCVHWPDKGFNYAVISPTEAAFLAVVPAKLDPQTAGRLA
jgi:hypothetical protein